MMCTAGIVAYEFRNSKWLKANKLVTHNDLTKLHSVTETDEPHNSVCFH